MEKVLRDRDLLRLVFESCAQTDRLLPSSLRLDHSSCRRWLHCARDIELVCSQWRDVVRDPSIWKALLRTRWPALCDDGNAHGSDTLHIVSSPRSAFAKLCGMRRRTQFSDLNLLIEAHDRCACSPHPRHWSRV